jgi:hypothetical protein
MSATIAKRTVFHVGDKVRVVEPLQVVRVGYPLTITDALNAAEKEYAEKVHVFMRDLGLEHNDDALGGTDYDGRLYNDLLNALASHWIRSKRFGGKERKIYTEVNERLRNTSGWTVLSKRHVKTGTYCRGGCSGGYDGEPDYNPPYLSGEQTHTLLTLDPPDWKLSLTAIEIEAVNVEKEGSGQ